MKVLIVGGYGIFGGRLAELLENEPRITVIISGRSLDKAEAFCTSRRQAKAQMQPAVFDRQGDVSAQLAVLQPHIVVDASGPFQDYGSKAYALIEACIARGIHYLDLADGAAFVEGVKQFDAAAKKAGVFVFTGVSSFPVLTAAAVTRLSEGMAKIRKVRGGIAPSPYAGVGTNVLRAIAGYAGQEIPLRRGGTTQKAYPLTETTRYTIAAPGKIPVRNILFSLVDVPDLRVLPAMWPELEEVWMCAGPVPEILHRALIGFAWLVRLKLLRSILFLAPLMEFVMRHVTWGEHRGGMFVEVTGDDAKGGTARRSWHLLAERTDGPLIPSMAAEWVIRQHLAGRKHEPGARTATLTLEDYEGLFRSREIYAGIREDLPDIPAPLYKKILGPAWDTLPEQIRAIHDVLSEKSFTGAATITRGGNPLAWLACRIMSFPKAGENIPLKVTFTVKDGVETWARDFGGQKFFSRQYTGKGRSDRLVAECFGPLEFGIAITTDEGRLNLVLRRWAFCGIPLPMWLCVRAESYETVENGKFLFNVRMWHPLTGNIIHYRGWLS